MNKRFVPVMVILAAACGGGDGGVGVKTPPNDISSMAVGEVRVLNPTDIPNGIDLPAGPGARDYVIVVGNTSSAHDVPANFVVKADRSPTGAFGIETAADLRAQSSLQMSQVPLARTPQQAVENKVRAFERSNLSLRSRSGPLGPSRFSARRNTVSAQLAAPVVGDVVPINVPDASGSGSLCDNFFQTH
ncbi:MAG TPA: hypothetical protein VK481_08505, partial [Gemmatimonadaceae bacterium]|nr:hypothetical protein [Gemmatimonadaceae bacterium]